MQCFTLETLSQACFQRPRFYNKTYFFLEFNNFNWLFKVMRSFSAYQKPQITSHSFFIGAGHAFKFRSFGPVVKCHLSHQHFNFLYHEMTARWQQPWIKNPSLSTSIVVPSNYDCWASFVSHESLVLIKTNFFSLKKMFLLNVRRWHELIQTGFRTRGLETDNILSFLASSFQIALTGPV